jgi:hypothetical protein
MSSIPVQERKKKIPHELASTVHSKFLHHHKHHFDAEHLLLSQQDIHTHLYVLRGWLAPWVMAPGHLIITSLYRNDDKFHLLSPN